MEGTEENNLQEEQTTNEASAAAENQAAENVSQEPNRDEMVASYLKEKGFEFESIDDLRKPIEKIVEKEVNPYADILDDEDKAYLTFKKDNPGLGRKEFEALNKDYDAVPSLELARERVRREAGNNSLTNEQIDEYLEGELGISLEDIDGRGEIKLSSFAKQLRDEKKAEQEKYRKPAENKQPSENPQQNGELVQLDNGAVMPKAAYEKMVADHQKNIEEAKEAVKQVKSTSFKLKVDDNGVERELEYTYDYAQEDTDGMSSIISDVQGTIEKTFKTDKGLNHGELAEGMLWGFNKKFREKAISDIASKVRAEAVEEVMKAVGNHNFNPQQPIQQQQKEGVKMVSFADIMNRM